MGWTSTMDATLRRMADEGKSARETCIVIGKTRASVIGRAYRLGICFRGLSLRLATPWTKDRETRLVALTSEGLSAAEIARELCPNGTITRNAVIDKRRRMGLRAPPKHTPGASHVKRKAKPVRPVLTVVPPPAPVEPQEPEEPEATPTETRMLYLGSGQCKWPLEGRGEGAEAFFCGAPVKPDLPYCACHADRAYKAPPTSARDLARKLRRHYA